MFNRFRGVTMIGAALLLLCMAAAACGSSDSPGAGTSGGVDAGTGGDTDAGPPPDNQGVVPDPIVQSGVTYIAHWHTEAGGQDKLMWYRTDGDAPRFEGEMDVGNPTQGMALDPVNDLLALVSDVGKSITLYKLSRPASPSDPVVAPAEVGRFEYGDAGIPVAVFFSPYQHRVYIAVSPPGGVFDNNDLYAYDTTSSDDVSAESWLRPIDGWPYQVPVSVRHAVDSARGLLFVSGLKDEKLSVYDLSDDGPAPIPGGAIDLAAEDPVPTGLTTQVGFQAREVRVDPWRHRVYVVRSQSIFSEMMAYEYPDDVPRFGAAYGDFASTSDFQKISDAFEVNKPIDERPNLLDGYDVDIDVNSGAVFMSADAWNGTSSTALIANFSPSLQDLGSGCSEHEGFGCFVRYVANDAPSGYQRTDGAMCTDSAHNVVVATSVETNETDPGLAHFYKYQDDLSMTRWNPASGRTLRASSLPVAAVCH